MAFDFMNDSMMSDDTKFVKLCESIEDCIREVDGGAKNFHSRNKIRNRYFNRVKVLISHSR